MTLPYDYPYTSFRYQFERALILLKSQGLNDDKIEDIKIKLVSKGLRLIGQKTVIMTPVLFSQLFNEDSGVLADVAVALCFEGFQAISYIKRLANNPREIGADLMWYLYPPSTIASKLNLIFTQREIQSWSYPLQRMAIANEPDFILNLPSAHLHIGSFSQEFSVSLGLLKQLTEDNFVNWSKILMTYFQEHNDAARIGDESKWLRFLRYNNKEAVIVFNGPSLAIKNQDMDIKYEFKLSDIAALLEISVNHNQDFLRFIISRSTIEGSLHDNSHKITIDLSEFNYEGYGGNLRNINEDIEILRLAIKSQFKMPIVEIFILEDKAKLFKVINNEMCRILVLNNFENWDSILLELF